MLKNDLLYCPHFYTLYFAHKIKFKNICKFRINSSYMYNMNYIFIYLSSVSLYNHIIIYHYNAKMICCAAGPIWSTQILSMHIHYITCKLVEHKTILFCLLLVNHFIYDFYQNPIIVWSHRCSTEQHIKE